MAMKKNMIMFLIRKDSRDIKMNFKGNLKRSSSQYIMERMRKRQRLG